MSLCLGTTYGPGMQENGVIPLFINKARDEEPITIQGTGQQFRQFTYIDDIANAFELSLDYEGSRAIFDIVAEGKVTIAGLP